MPVENSTPKIVVESVKPINKGSLAAFAVVIINDKVKIHGVRIIHQPGQAAWVAMPQKEIPPKAAGEKPKYFPIIEILDAKLKGEISDAVLAEYGHSIAERVVHRENDLPRAVISPAPFVGTDEDVPF